MNSLHRSNLRLVAIALSLVVGSTFAADVVQPAKVGFDARGNWIDVNSMTWTKIMKGDFTFQYAKNQCKTKDAAEDVTQWQLPTSKQAESFYKNTVRQNLLANSGWELGSVWTSTVGTGFNHQVMNLMDGTISWAGVPDVDSENKFVICVALPQGFDREGNYFDGRLFWSKIANESVTRTAAFELCEKKSPAGMWRLPSYEQLYEFADTLIFRTALTKGIAAKGWALGMTFSTGNSIALGVEPNAPMKGFVTCVRS